MKDYIELGDKVKCIYDERSGIAVMREISLQKCDRVGVSVRVDNGVSKIVIFDRPELKILKKGVISPRKEHDSPHIELGDMVKCLITGVEGVAVSREIYLFRCDRIGVQPVSKDKRNFIDAFTLDAQTLKVIKKKYVTLKETSEPQKNVGCRMIRKERP